MKTIGIVSLVYLPGTFAAVSPSYNSKSPKFHSESNSIIKLKSIFGMSFFDTQVTDGRVMNMLEDFWLYWSIAVPLSIATILVWAACHYRVYITRVVFRRK